MCIYIYIYMKIWLLKPVAWFFKTPSIFFFEKFENGNSSDVCFHCGFTVVPLPGYQQFQCTQKWRDQKIWDTIISLFSTRNEHVRPLKMDGWKTYLTFWE